MKDFLNQTIEVGDTVVLAKRDGNSAEMVLRMVSAIDTKHSPWSVQVENFDSGRRGWTKPNHLVVVTDLNY